MNLALPRILENLPDFNKRSFNADDFWLVCGNRNIDVFERKQKKRGYYLADDYGDLVFIDSRLKNFVWLQVAFHELTHALLHFPSPFLAGKQQFEANAFSIMLICTQTELAAGSEMRRAAKFCHVLRFILREREKIYFLYQDFGIRN